MALHVILLLLVAALTAGCQSAETVKSAGTGVSSPTVAAVASQQIEGHWLNGSWDDGAGVVLDVWSVRSDGTAEGTMGRAGQARLRATFRIEGSRVRVVNAIKDDFDLTLESDGRLAGTTALAADRTVQPWSATKKRLEPCTKPITVSVRAYGPPTYCVLDTWIFSSGRVQSVLRVDDDGVVIAGPDLAPGRCRECIYHFDRNLRPRSVERADGQPVGMFDGLRVVGDGWHLWDFPLALNKSWRSSGDVVFRGIGAVYTAECMVTAYEEVTTKAGTFKAFKVVRSWRSKIVGDDRDRGDRWSDTLWFAPEVKTTVKRTMVHTSIPEDSDWELVSYSLK